MRNLLLAAIAALSLSAFALPAAHADSLGNGAYQSGYDSTVNSAGQVPVVGHVDF
jgi:hypothetical protein